MIKTMNKAVDAIEVGKRLKKLRGIKTRAGVARELGISYSGLCKYESGLKVPNDKTKVLIANYYGVPVQQIFFDP